jgi:sugar lactone lactonase YvrE
MDEVSVYSRALAPSEIAGIYAAGAAGKCRQVPPVIVTQPVSQRVGPGSNVTLNVTAGGTGPFRYQWHLNVTNLLNNFITTVAGTNTSGYSGDGGPAANASLTLPYGVAMDGVGNLFIGDWANNRIRMVGTNGIITTVAGVGPTGTGSYSGDGGPATNAHLYFPGGVAVDSLGNLFIADQYNSRIRKVGTNGTITTVAGTNSSGYSGDGGPAANAKLNHPLDVAPDSLGNLFIADDWNSRVRKVGTNGIITTVAGTNSSGYSGDGGPAVNAALDETGGLLLDGLGDLFIADYYNNRIRVVGPNGIITTVAGIGPSGSAGGYSGDGGPAANAGLYYPSGVAMDNLGNIFIADCLNNRVRMVGPNGIIVTLAGTNTYGYSGDGGPAGNAMLDNPSGLVADNSGNLFFADNGNNRIRKVTMQGGPSLTLTDVGAASAGNYTVTVSSPYGSVSSTVAVLAVGLLPTILASPQGATVLAGSNVAFNVTVAGTGPFTYQWQLNGTNLPNNIITTVAGTNAHGYSGDGGPAVNASLYNPYAVAVDSLGNLFIADYDNNRIRKVDTNGMISTLAGIGPSGSTGSYSGDGGPATNASLYYPSGVAVDSLGNLFFGDWGNNRIRKVGTNGIITTVAGTNTDGYSGDGGPAANAGIYMPSGVFLDSLGNLFIADTGDCRIRKVGTNGAISTVAGSGSIIYSGDGGLATSAGLSYPSGVAVDSLGNLFITDNENNRIRKVGTNQIISTVAGIGPSGSAGSYSGDGGPATNAHLYYPSGVAVDSLGNLFIADDDNNRIRKVDTNAIITTLAGIGPSGSAGSYSGDGGPAANASLNYPSSLVLDNSGNLFFADSGNNRIRKITLPSNPTLTLADVGAANAGNYSVVVSSPYGSVTSAVATLTVHLPPALTTQPQSQFIVNGQPASLTVSASGTPPLLYQWFQNGTNLQDNGNLSGSATSNMTLNAADTNSIGDYTVVVTNAYGSATSMVAVISVGFAPSIATQPSNQTVFASSTLTLSMGASGTGPFAWQWQLNGTNLPNILITTVAGTNSSGYSGDGGPAVNAQLTFPYGVALDGLGNLFIADENNGRIRKVGTNGIITTAAGTNSKGYSGDGGPAVNARLSSPYGVAMDSLGDLFIADYGDNLIRKVGTNGIITTVAGSYPLSGYSGDGGPAVNARLSSPSGVAVDSLGNLFIADQGNYRIRKVGTNGIITTVAGTNSGGYSGDGGPAVNASLSQTTGVALDSLGNLFIADQGNYRIRKVGTNGIITTVAGTNTWGYSGDGGPAVNATLYKPSGVAVDVFGNLFIADYYNNRIREVGTSGIITTVAGTSSASYSGDGGPAANASLYHPFGVALDSLGNLFIADEINNRIRKVTLLGSPTLILTNVGAASAGNYALVVTNSYGAVTSAVVTVSVAVPPLNATIIPPSATNFAAAVQFQCCGAPGCNYLLQYTTNLAPPVLWQPLITNAADTNGTWSFTDTNASAFPARFFRTAVP